MPKKTYTQINSVTLASSASSVTFSNIPATYRDLILVSNNLGTANNTGSVVRFNGDSGSNYSRVFMYGTGSVSSSGADTSTSMNLVFPRTTVGVFQLQIMDYSATDKHKTVLNRTDTSEYVVWASAGRWASTSALTSIYLAPESGSWATGATFNLYGVIA